MRRSGYTQQGSDIPKSRLIEKLKALYAMATRNEKTGNLYMPPKQWMRLGFRKRNGPGTAKSYLPGVRKGAFLLSGKEWAEKYPGRHDRPRQAV